MFIARSSTFTQNADAYISLFIITYPSCSSFIFKIFITKPWSLHNCHIKFSVDKTGVISSQISSLKVQFFHQRFCVIRGMMSEDGWCQKSPAFSNTLFSVTFTDAPGAVIVYFWWILSKRFSFINCNACSYERCCYSYILLEQSIHILLLIRNGKNNLRHLTRK